MRLRKIVYARCNLQIDNNNIFLPYCPKKENAFLSFMEVILISNCTFISLSSFASQTIQIFLKTNIFLFHCDNKRQRKCLQVHFVFQQGAKIVNGLFCFQLFPYLISRRETNCSSEFPYICFLGIVLPEIVNVRIS